MMPNRKYRTRSTGEMISTFVYAGMAVWIASEALIWQGSTLAKVTLFICAFLSALGAIRFPLQQFADWLRR